VDEDFLMDNENRDPGATNASGAVGGDGSSWWTAELRESAVSELAALPRVPHLGRLWNLSVPEEDFVQLLARPACALLEASAAGRGLSEKSLGLLVLLIDSLVREWQQAGPLGAVLVDHVIKHAALTPIVARVFAAVDAAAASAPADGATVAVAQEMLADFLRADAAELARSTESAKNVEAFLLQLATLRPALLLACVDDVLGFLQTESYVLRNAVVQCVGRVISAAAELGDESEEAGTPLVDEATRTTLLGMLLQRVEDVSSYTRSKTLQVWCDLVEARAVPSALFAPMATAAVGRLRDRTAAVRKYAVALLTAALRFNPYGPALPARELTEALEKIGADAEDTAQALRETIAFVEQLHLAIAPMDIMTRGSKSDAIEVVQFYTACAQFQLDAAADGFRRILPLIWSKEAGIRDAIVHAYYTVHIQPAEESLLTGDAKSKAAMRSLRKAYATTQMVRLALGDLGAEASMEALLMALAEAKHLGAAELAALLDIASRAVPGASPADAALAARATAMIAAKLGESELRCGRPAWARLLRLVESAVPAETAETAAETAEAMTIAGSAVEAMLLAHRAGQHARIPNSDASLRAIVSVVTVPLVPMAAVERWMHASEHAVALMFAQCELPLLVAKELVLARHRALLHEQNSLQEAMLLHVLGLVALQTRAHVEDIQAHLTRSKSRSNKPSSASSEDATAADGGGGVTDKLEEELGVVAMQEENEAEWIASVLDNELIHGSATFLGAYGEYVKLATQRAVAAAPPAAADARAGDVAPQRFHETLLARAAALCLSRFMVCSREYCQANLLLLHTAFRRSPLVSVRATAAVALGDLHARYPNLLEPWSPHFNGALRDESVDVRKSTMMVLTHMTLNDMMKARTFVSEIAARLEDPDVRIRDLARSFFTELSQKNNELYNVLPDILSCLSSGGMPSNGFRRVVRFLFGFVQKERQVESFVEKLCHRFQKVKTTTDSIDSLADLVYCITLLGHSEKTVRKMIELGKCYSDMLVHDAVLQPLQQLAARLRKSSAKDSLRVQAEEWESHLLAWAEGKELDTAGLSVVTTSTDGSEEGEKPSSAADGIELL
jgi:condensin complex subunit 1